MPRADAPLAELLPWDSEFFGRTIGRVTAETLTPETFAAVESWASEHGVECLYFEAAADDAVAIRTAEDGGFRLVEIRVVLRRPRRPRFPFDDFPPPSEGVLMREGRTDDLEELQRIAADSYGDSRFYVDPHFPDEQAGKLYATWIEKSLEGYQANTVLVAEVDGHVAGFTTTREFGSFAHIGLIAVDPELMHSTLAPRVAHSIAIALLRWADERNLGIHAVTQGRNVRTQRYIQRYGFHVHRLSLYFHRWHTP